MFEFELVDFSALTPEANAELLGDAGGANSLFLASRAWSALSRQLWIAVGNIYVALRALPRVWTGPAATGMAKAGARYLAWLRDTIAHVEVTAAQIERIAVAYDAAQTAMVPKQTCADLRAAIDGLIAQDRFGENYPVIAANEAKYHQHWESNAQVMKTYAKEVSTALSLMTPFAEAPQIVHQTKAVETASCLVQ
ncbi:PPE family protein [Mycobacterium haemophilum]